MRAQQQLAVVNKKSLRNWTTKRKRLGAQFVFTCYSSAPLYQSTNNAVNLDVNEKAVGCLWKNVRKEWIVLQIINKNKKMPPLLDEINVTLVHLQWILVERSFFLF